MRESPAPTYRLGDFRVNVAERLLTQQGREVPLSAKAFDTLVVFLRAPGRVLTREELMEAVWPDAVVSEGNLTHQIWLLRRVLPEETIETVPREGYRLRAAVTREEAGTRPTADAAPPEAIGATPPERKGRRVLVPAIVAAVLLVLAGGLTFRTSRPRAREPRMTAVLAFTNLAGATDAVGERLRSVFEEAFARHVPRERVDRVGLPSSARGRSALSHDSLARIAASTGGEIVVLGTYLERDAASGRSLRLDVRAQDVGSGETIALVSRTGDASNLDALAAAAAAELRRSLSER